MERGLAAPADLVSACTLLGEVKTFQDDCLKRVTVLDNAKTSAGKMTCHDYAERNVESYMTRLAEPLRGRPIYQFCPSIFTSLVMAADHDYSLQP